MSEASNSCGPDRAERLRRKVPIEQMDLLIRRLYSLPAVPEVVAALVDLAGRADGAEPETLAAVAGTDPSVAACLLAASSRRHGAAAACSGRRRPARSVLEAVEVLGHGGVRSAVTGMDAVDAASASGGGLDFLEFRAHCVATACASELLAERMGGRIDPRTAYDCGLLHDIGKAAIDRFLPKTYRRVLAAVAAGAGNVIGVERDIIGVDHTVVGRRLARHWDLPACVQEVIWMHHQPAGAIPATLENPDLVAVVQLADAIVRREGIGFSGNHVFATSNDALGGRIGLTAEDISAVAGEVSDRLERRMALVAEAGGKARRAGESPCRGATVRTGEELLRLTESLSDRADGLAGRAQALKRLDDLALRVSPATALPKFCEEVALMFSDVASIQPGPETPVGVFAVGDAGNVILALCSGPENSPATTLRVSPSGTMEPDVPAGVGICPAGTILRPLLRRPDAWSDLFDVDGFTCVPLIAEGRLAGGVLLPGEPADREYDGPLLATLGRISAIILAAVAARASADRLAEQLAQASQRLDEARQALAQSHALAAVGEMAAGAAHEINNPLAVICGRAQLLASLVETDKAKETAGLIAVKSQEISDIVTDLMAFARPAASAPEAVDVMDLLRGAENRFKSQSVKAGQKTDGITVDISVEPDCPSVWIDSEQIEHALRELLRNAAACLPEARRRQAAGQGRVNVTVTACRSNRPGSVLIKVSDDGPGMDETTLASAFTPFFSHRPAGRGRGMGLTRARRFVQCNGGRIWIRSRSGSGTIVFVELPCARHDAAAREKPETPGR